jgi:hypothetical protein
MRGVEKLQALCAEDVDGRGIVKSHGYPRPIWREPRVGRLLAPRRHFLEKQSEIRTIKADKSIVGSTHQAIVGGEIDRGAGIPIITVLRHQLPIIGAVDPDTVLSYQACSQIAPVPGIGKIGDIAVPTRLLYNFRIS